MLKNRAPQWLLALVLAGACVGLAVACGLDGVETAPPIKAPGAFPCAAVAGDHVYAVTPKGKLIDVDLKAKRVRDLGAPADKLSPFVDVAGGKALVASPGKVHLVDLASGKVLRWAPFRGDAIHGLGLLGPDRAFVHTGTAVVVLDLSWPQTVHTVELAPAGTKGRIDFGGRTAAWARVGQRLYTADPFGKGLVVVDLERGKVVDRLETPAWRVGGVQVVGDKALVVGLRYGYGVWTNSLGEIDLKTKKYTARKLLAPASLRPCSLLAGPGGHLFLSDGRQVYRVDAASGRLTPQLTDKAPGHLVGFWGGSALVSTSDEVRFLFTPVAPAPRAAAKTGR
jgi:hypothetical protein